MKGFSPVWILKCRLRTLEEEKVLPQSEHLCLKMIKSNVPEFRMFQATCQHRCEFCCAQSDNSGKQMTFHKYHTRKVSPEGEQI